MTSGPLHASLMFVIGCRNLDKVSLLSAIDNIVYPGGGRNTSGALRILLTEVFASSADERPDTTTTAILITNGVPTAEKDELAAAIVDLQYSDVITFAVGVTKAVPEFIPQYISSDPHEVRCYNFTCRGVSAFYEKESIQCVFAKR